MLGPEPVPQRAEGRGECAQAAEPHCGLTCTAVCQPILSSQADSPAHLALRPDLAKPLPCLLPLLLKLSKPCNLLVLLLFSHSHLPLVLGYELNPGLLSFPAVGCVLS